MKIIFKIAVLSSVLFLTSCATIMSGSRQKVSIASDPTSAKIYINGIDIGNTPVQKNLKRNQEYNLVLKMDGYDTYETKLERKFNAWYIGNIAFGGLIGVIIDPITGAVHKLEPEEINGSPKRGTAYITKNGKLFIKISMDIDSNSKRIGQLKKAE
ncbi:PEGA domain-containing protein [Tenacibaculum maritimum]|uniref:PEGA domain-containing protein n=1 Tax=Tenacibaculum maritimum TaxID=107401 RepID=UPI0012E49427|nr:PEGA domain-containing protein [Tenacibaculum maritimum]CAA0230241.1 Probable lipoprotein precursor [Tenacibaculum maritimum]